MVGEEKRKIWIYINYSNKFKNIHYGLGDGGMGFFEIEMTETSQCMHHFHSPWHDTRQTPIKKIPHAGDKASLDRCG